ncbi:aminoacyltransferase [Candidatus Gracilibacteria bacterium]|nr:aminoacyltransferase [Candidatus Gracilibacteria bacterium]
MKKIRITLKISGGFILRQARDKSLLLTKKYFQDLFDKDFSRMISLIDPKGKVQCSWFGVIIGNTLYYLYGGNTQDSFDNYGQYLVHVAATYLGKKEGVSYYDLGGYDPEKGFGKFKEGYKGIIRHFGYPMDLILQARKYHFTSRFVQTAKTFRDVIPFM